MKFSSQIEIEGSKKVLEVYYNALSPEAEETKRAKYSLKLGKKLIIKVEAEDATAFRAVMTSLMGLISIIDKSLKQ